MHVIESARTSASLRSLSDLRVSAVNHRLKYTQRGDAENAEEALRISNQNVPFTSLFVVLRTRHIINSFISVQDD
jgi:hypothetical protein